jgi:hypothetical protein
MGILRFAPLIFTCLILLTVGRTLSQDQLLSAIVIDSKAVIRLAEQMYTLKMPRSGLKLKVGSILDYEKTAWTNVRKNILIAGAYRGDILSVNSFDINLDYLYGDDTVDRGDPALASFESQFLTQRIHMRLAKNFTSNPETYPDFSFQFLTEYFHDELLNESKMIDNTRSSNLYEASLYDNRASLGGVISIGDKLDSLGQVNWKLFGGLRGEVLATGKNYKISSYGFQVNFIKDKLPVYLLIIDTFFQFFHVRHIDIPFLLPLHFFLQIVFEIVKRT